MSRSQAGTSLLWIFELCPKHHIWFHLGAPRFVRTEGGSGMLSFLTCISVLAYMEASHSLQLVFVYPNLILFPDLVFV